MPLNWSESREEEENIKDAAKYGRHYEPNSKATWMERLYFDNLYRRELASNNPDLIPPAEPGPFAKKIISIITITVLSVGAYAACEMLSLYRWSNSAFFLVMAICVYNEFYKKPNEKKRIEEEKERKKRMPRYKDPELERQYRQHLKRLSGKEYID